MGLVNIVRVACLDGKMAQKMAFVCGKNMAARFFRVAKILGVSSKHESEKVYFKRFSTKDPVRNRKNIRRKLALRALKIHFRAFLFSRFSDAHASHRSPFKNGRTRRGKMFRDFCQLQAGHIYFCMFFQGP